MIGPYGHMASEYVNHDGGQVSPEKDAKAALPVVISPIVIIVWGRAE